VTVGVVDENVVELDVPEVDEVDEVDLVVDDVALDVVGTVVVVETLVPVVAGVVVDVGCALVKPSCFASLHS